MTIGSVQLLAKSFSCRVTLSHWKNAAAVRCKVPRTCPTLRTISSTTRVEKSVQSPSSRDETPPQPPPPSESGLFRLLSAQERELLLEQRNLTATARKLSNQVLRGLEYSSITSTSSSSTNPSAIQQAASTLSQFVSTSSPSSSASFLDGLNLEASFSVVVAGEFNAGKSTLINALLGFKLLESGALPTTDTITIVTSSSSSQQQQQSSSSSSSQLPLGVTLHNVPNVPILQDVTLIDTPGTNSAWIDHTERTLRLLPSADMILFVTSADRPFPQSERTLLAGIQSYRKSIVMVVNKMDILNADGGDHGKSSKQAVVDFVTEQSSELLGARPIVIPVSARDALSSKLMEKKTTTTSTITNHPNHHSTQSLQHSSLMDPQQQQQQQRSNVWYRSNFAQLESFLKESLTTQTKLKSKLMNPIGVSEGMMKQCLDLLSHQQQDLQADITTLHVLETQLDGWKTELTFDLKLFCQKAMEMVQSQGDRWNILLARMNYWTFHYWFLIDHVRLEQEWIDTQRTVSLHRPHQLQPPAKKQQQPSNAKEEQDGWKDDLLVEVKEIAETVATRGRAQGQAVIEYLGRRPAVQNQSLIGSVTAASRFEDTRKNLQDRLSGAVHATFRNNEEQIEKEEVRSFLWRTAVVSAGLQSGTLGSLAAISMDMIGPISGLIIAMSLAMSSGACYAMGTNRISHYYTNKWSTRANDLGNALTTICDNEVERVSRRIMSGVGPYSRYVESEQERIAKLHEQCEDLRAAAQSLRNRITKVL